MQKNFIITLGVVVAILPFITIPSSIKNPLYVLLGAGIAYAYWRERRGKKKGIHPALQRKLRRPVGSVTPVPLDGITTPPNATAEPPKEQ